MTAKELKRLRDKSRELYLMRKRQLQQAAGVTGRGSSQYYHGSGISGHSASGMPTDGRSQFAGEYTVKSGVDPSPADVAKFVAATGGDPYAAKLKKAMSRSKTEKSREALRQRLQQAAGTQGSSQQSVVDQMLGDVKAKIDEANAANDARYDEVKGSNEALYGRGMGEVDNWGGVQSQLNEERAAESLSNQKAYLAARGLSNSNVLPAFQARNDRDLALTQQDLSERKSARRLGYDIDLTNNANAFIERRNDIAPDMAPYYDIALQYAKSGAGQQPAQAPSIRKPKRGGRTPSPVNALLSARRAAQLQSQVGGAYGYGTANQMMQQGTNLTNQLAYGGTPMYGPSWVSNAFPHRKGESQDAAYYRRMNQ